MDKDRIAGAAKDFAGKVEGAAGNLAGDAKTEASGRVREAAGTVQNLYGQAKDAARDATDAAASYARDTFQVLSTTAARRCATARRPWRRRCRTIRSARCWSPAVSALRWRC